MRWIVVLFLSWIAIVRTDNFSLENIRGPQIASSACTAEIRQRLSMPYRYLSSGRQTYVFGSEDGKTVLKLFKKAYYSTPWYTPFLPWKEKEIAKREKRRFFYFESYRIAWREFPEETGLLFVGCGRDLPPLRLFDRVHRWHEIDLNEVSFVLQKRGEPLYPMLAALEPDSLKKAIDQFLLQIAQRIEKGIADGDQDIEHNFGWDCGIVLHLDPGRLFYNAALQDPHLRREEWRSSTHRFRKWLARELPEIVPFFDARLDALQK